MAQCSAAGKAVVSQTRARAGEWFHVAGVRDFDSISIYVNGVLESKRATVQPDAYANGQDLMKIGGNDFDSAFLSGLVDEVALYWTPLSPAQVSALYEAGRLLDSRSRRRARGPGS